MTRLHRFEDRFLNPTPRLVVLAFVAFAADAVLYRWLGVKAIGFRGPFDEIDHLLTTVLIVWALFIPWLARRQVLPVLVASCLIDLDHLPGQLGSTILTGAGPRPYTHSLATVAVVLLVAMLWRRNRLIYLAVAVGITSHLWRDLAEPAHSAVMLFWPVTREPIHLNAVFYFSSIVIFAGIAMGRSLVRTSRPLAAV